MNEIVDLDDLKSQWKEQQTKTKYSQNDLKSMLNRKSVNNVKYILLISIFEFSLGIFALIYLHFINKTNQNLNHSIPDKFVKEIEEFSKYYLLYDIIYCIVFGYFIIKFYTYYKKLQTDSSIRDYILQIINFRKWVHYFIYFNIALFILVLISVFSFSVYEFVKIYEIQTGKQMSIGKAIFIGSVGTVIFGCTLGGILWLYYRLVYGIFLKRLKHNLSELEEIEE